MQKVLTKQLFGTFVILVIMLSAVEQSYANVPMSYYDLDHFAIDCSKKREQTEFLQSMYGTDSERRSARITNALTPWTVFTDKTGRARQKYFGNGEYNWVIRQKLHILNTQCF